MRKFIRHPSSIPIQLIEQDGSSQHIGNTLNNVSFGGVCCLTDNPVEEGAPVTIRIECVDPDFEMTGKAVWCRPADGAYEIGIEFLASKDKVFLLRMVEQLCHIEHYRNEIKNSEGRDVNSEQAAKEWIEKYADDFPR